VRGRLEIDPLAVNGRERIPMLPFVPTVFEAGYLVNDRLWPLGAVPLDGVSTAAIEGTVAVGGHENADLPIVRTTVDDANPRADL
jgi:hypothetical protein